MSAWTSGWGRPRRRLPDAAAGGLAGCRLTSDGSPSRATASRTDLRPRGSSACWARRCRRRGGTHPSDWSSWWGGASAPVLVPSWRGDVITGRRSRRWAAAATTHPDTHPRPRVFAVRSGSSGTSRCRDAMLARGLTSVDTSWSRRRRRERPERKAARRTSPPVRLANSMSRGEDPAAGGGRSAARRRPQPKSGWERSAVRDRRRIPRARRASRARMLAAIGSARARTRAMRCNSRWIPTTRADSGRRGWPNAR